MKINKIIVTLVIVSVIVLLTGAVWILNFYPDSSIGIWLHSALKTLNGH